MRSDDRQPSAREYVTSLAASGRHTFGSRKAQRALGVSSDATKLALSRLARQSLDRDVGLKSPGYLSSST